MNQILYRLHDLGCIATSCSNPQGIDPKVQPELIKVAKVLQKDARKAVSTKAEKVLSGL